MFACPPTVPHGGHALVRVEHTLIETTYEQNGTEPLGDRLASEIPSEAPSAWPAHDEGVPLQLCETNLAELCRSALADVVARFPDRAIDYAPDPDPTMVGAGEWDARRVAYAVTILLEDALKRAREPDAVSLRWREGGDGVVLRVQYPRPLERGDRFVSYFEDGVRPDGAADSIGTLRIVVALKIARQHRGTLARIRTRAGTTYVLELPRRVLVR
jgi:hypothetical protein